MSVFAFPVKNRPWFWQITLLSVILGGVLALSLKTQDRLRREQLPNMRPNQIALAYARLNDTVQDQKKTISEMQQKIEAYRNAISQDSGKAGVLAADLDRASLLTGQKSVMGSGVIVILKDAEAKNVPPKDPGMSDEDYIGMTHDYIIHDSDIQRVVNELKAAGAEAIAINDQRVVAMTSIRCVGPVVHVNSIATTGSPVRIQAIGDAKALMSGLQMTGGIVGTFGDISMISIEKSESIILPAYTGVIPLRYVKITPEQKAQQAQDKSDISAQQGGEVLKNSANTPVNATNGGNTLGGVGKKLGGAGKLGGK
jgi:uncharacterized protein YlxW (UPF0749 family)